MFKIITWSFENVMNDVQILELDVIYSVSLF